MTYLVTGATGFIGSNIMEQLAFDGYKAVGLSNSNPSPRQNLFAKSSDIQFICGDVRNQEHLEAIVREHDISRIIHAAVITSDAEREKHSGPEIVDVNLRGAAVVANVAARCGIERFTLVSSAGVYSTHQLPDGLIVDEEHARNVDTLYGIGKSAAETIVSRICSLNSIPYVIGRVATAFGPWEHDTGFRDTLSPIYQLTKAAQQGGEVVLQRDKKSNWHYSRDAAQALITLTSGDRKPRHNDYNLGPECVWPLSRWCELLKQRFPSFRYSFCEQGGNIELYGASDGGVLSGKRYADEFGPTALYTPASAFEDFLRWLDHG